MKENTIISETKDYIRNKFQDETSGHDWWHIYRVWQLSKSIAIYEQNANPFIVEISALLHDIADWKFHDGDEKIGGRIAKEWLLKKNVPSTDISKIIHIIDNASYKGANVESESLSLEGQIVQDADRLDAIGAIGIARTFAYGGHDGRLIYDPEVKPTLHNTFEEYKKDKGHTINHFYEKLLLLKDKMNTKTGAKIALERHQFMELFLKQFYSEWVYNT